MIPVLKNRLEEILNKYSEIESKLLDIDINIDIRLSLTKEHSDLSPVIIAINELQSCETEIEGVKEILDDIKLSNSKLYLCCLMTYGCLLRPFGVVLRDNLIYLSKML